MTTNRDIAALIQGGRYDEAIVVLTPLSDAGDASSSNNLAIIARHQKDEAKELYFSTRAYGQDPNSPAVLNTLMRAYRSQKTTRSLADLYRSVRDNRGLGRLHHLWGAEALIDTNRTDAAAKALARCEGFPKSDELYDQLIALKLAGANSDHDEVLRRIDQLTALGVRTNDMKLARLFAAGRMTDVIDLFEAHQTRDPVVRAKFKTVILAALALRDATRLRRLLALGLDLPQGIHRVATAFLDGDSEVVVKGSKRSYRFPFSPTNLSISIPHATGAFYERDLLNRLARLMKSSSVMIDVGANIGNHTVFFAGEVGCSVIPFECNPRLVPLLRAAIDNAGLGELVDTANLGAAVSDSVGEVFFNFMRDDYSNVGLSSAGGAQAVRAVSLDSLKFEKADLIKIDVDGAERLVLAGMKETVQRLRPSVAIEVLNPNTSWVREWFAEAGYDVLHEDATSETYSEFIMVPRESPITEF